MADIDQIIAGGSGAGTTADFSGIPKLLDYYYKGKDEAAKNDLREAFKGGVPLTPDGQPDFASMAKTLFQKGGLSEGTAAANLGLAQQNMQFGQGQSRAIQDFDRGGQPQTPIVSPSVNRQVPIAGNAPVRAAPAGTAQSPQGQSSPQGDQPGSIVGLISAAGIPDELAGPVIQQVSALTKTDPNAALDPTTSQRVQQVVQAAALRMKGGQQPQPSGLTPQAAPPPSMQPPQQPMAGQPAPVTNALTTTQGPTEPSRAEKGIAFFSGIMANPNTPKQQFELAKSRLEALQKSNELTPDQRNYVQYKLEGGKGTMEDFLNRADENTTQRDILTKSTIPRLEKSQDKATSSIEDIDAIHRSRIELDQPGGVITGAWASDRLKLAKIGNYLGIPNTDKITNTEAFSAAVGKRVAAMVKAFGSGTAISDGDRRFAEKMAGGGIELNETSMRRILDIGEQADRAIIDRHNEFADKAVKSNEGLKSARDTFIVQQPGQYKKPGADTSFPRFSSPSDVKAAVSSGKLKSGDAFLTSDGRTKYVP
jgi:hypothetical protein